MATRINNNNRLFYGVTAVGVAATGGVFKAVSGVQSVGIDTTFNLEQVYQLGQLSIYQNVENIPNVEVTIERVMDGTALAQHLATPQTGIGPELIGRYGNQRCDVAVNFYRDTMSNASGVPGDLANKQAQSCYMSGMYVSSIGFNLGVDGNFTETVSLVGNSKNWASVTGSPTATGFGGSTMFYPTFGTAGSLAPPTGFVARRQNIVFGYAAPTGNDLSFLPTEIPGIDATGYNRLSYGTLALGGAADWQGNAAHVQSIQISADLGRTELFELGKRGPYHRYLDFPIEVTCAIEVVDTQGDSMIAQTEVNNVTDQKIYVVINDGTVIDLGGKNRLTSVSSSAGDTGGGNRTLTFNYVNYNELTVTRYIGAAPDGAAASAAMDPAQATDTSPTADGYA